MDRRVPSRVTFLIVHSRIQKGLGLHEATRQPPSRNTVAQPCGSHTPTGTLPRFFL